MNKIAFLTTVFPMNLQYLIEMLDSLVEQTFNEFYLIVVNDGSEEFSELSKSYKKKLKIIELKGVANPAENRQIGINYCIEFGYDYLIFGDSDDTFSKNRVEQSVKLLKEYDVVVNDLTLFENDLILEKNYLSNRFKNNQVINFEDIINKNILGLSNTAIRLSKIERLVIPKELIAVDWYFFSLLLLQGRKAIFINDAVTYYRQYAGNLVGLKELDEKAFKRGWQVKRVHYQALSKITDRVNIECEQYSQEMPDYTQKESNQAHPLWWELI
jgi:glycosyltransferase involved in cell wall biosynthesis